MNTTNREILHTWTCSKPHLYFLTFIVPMVYRVHDFVYSPCAVNWKHILYKGEILAIVNKSTVSGCVHVFIWWPYYLEKMLQMGAEL